MMNMRIVLTAPVMFWPLPNKSFGLTDLPGNTYPDSAGMQRIAIRIPMNEKG